MSDEHDSKSLPAEDESVAMSRADEIGYINAAAPSSPAPAADAVVTLAPELAAPAAPGPRQTRALGVWAAVLRIGALASALTGVVGLFWSAYVELAMSDVVATVGDQLGVGVAPAAKSGQTMVLLVRSTPDGATVAVNGVEHGLTPAVIDLDCGIPRPVVTVVHQGFEPWRLEIACHPGTEARLDAPLKRRGAKRRQ